METDRMMEHFTWGDGALRRQHPLVNVDARSGVREPLGDGFAFPQILTA